VAEIYTNFIFQNSRLIWTRKKSRKNNIYLLSSFDVDFFKHLSKVILVIMGMTCVQWTGHWTRCNADMCYKKEIKEKQYIFVI